MSSVIRALLLAACLLSAQPARASLDCQGTFPNLTLIPGFNPHIQTGSPPGLGVSSCPSETGSVSAPPPSLIGKAQLQQISVIRLGNVPWQSSDALAG